MVRDWKPPISPFLDPQHRLDAAGAGRLRAIGAGSVRSQALAVFTPHPAIPKAVNHLASCAPDGIKFVISCREKSAYREQSSLRRRSIPLGARIPVNHFISDLIARIG
jgi:hypothetical protein